MKKKFLGALTGAIMLVGGAVYAINSTEQDCPLKGTADCPLVKECALKGTPDCPLKGQTVALADCCKKK